MGYRVRVGRLELRMKDLSAYIIDLISRKEKELGYDWRSSWSRVVTSDGEELKIEMSRAALMKSLADSIEGFDKSGSSETSILLRSASGECVRLLLPEEENKKLIWVVSSVVDLRREPDHSSELVSQAIMGETMTRLDSRGDWYFVRMEDDYHGWIRAWSVIEVPRAEIDDYAKKINARIKVNVGYVLSGRDKDSVPVTDIVAGTGVIASPADDARVYIALPGRKKGYLPASELAFLPAGETSRDGIIERAKHYLGIPYIWGGTSAKGFDCSGLIKRVYLLEGVSLPRDADQQSVIGKMIPIESIDNVRPADLLFFADGEKITHVAIALGKGKFIHAFGDVRINSYHETDPLYEEKLASKLVFGRSFLP